MSAAHNNTDSMVNPRPLLLLTRPEASSEAFCKALPQETCEAVDILISPLLSIRVTGPLPGFDGITGLIFTSVNALDAYRALGGQGLDMPVVAVGKTTARAASACGFDVDVAGGTADHLVQHILDRGYSGGLMHLRGEIAIGDIALRLSEAGVETFEAILYKQEIEPFSSSVREALSQDRAVIAPVFSPRTAEHLARESVGLGDMSYAAISRAVANALPSDAAGRTRISETPNREGMVALVADMVMEAVALERRKRDS